MPLTSERLSDLRSALETRMGELAALLSEVAEALTYYPGELRIEHSEVGADSPTPHLAMTINSREWPSIQEIDQLVTNWRELMKIAGASPPPTGKARRA